MQIRTYHYKSYRVPQYLTAEPRLRPHPLFKATLESSKLRCGGRQSYVQNLVLSVCSSCAPLQRAAVAVEGRPPLQWQGRSHHRHLTGPHKEILNLRAKAQDSEVFSFSALWRCYLVYTFSDFFSETAVGQS